MRGPIQIERNPVTRNIAVVGSGYMGGGIAQVLGLAGARVALTDVSAEVAQKNYDRLHRRIRDFVADGLFPEGATETLQANLWPATSLAEAVADADFIEECRARGHSRSSTTSWPDQRGRQAGRHHRIQHLDDLHRGDGQCRHQSGPLPGRALHQPVAVHPGRGDHPARRHPAARRRRSANSSMRPANRPPSSRTSPDSC